MGGNGSRGWVREVIGIDSGEDFNLPLGRHNSNFFCLPDRDCEVGGPSNEVLPQGLRAEILTGLRGKGTPHLGLFDGGILDSLHSGGNFCPLLHHHSRQQIPLLSPRNRLIKKVNGCKGGFGWMSGWEVNGM